MRPFPRVRPSRFVGVHTTVVCERTCNASYWTLICTTTCFWEQTQLPFISATVFRFWPETELCIFLLSWCEVFYVSCFTQWMHCFTGITGWTLYQWWLLSAQSLLGRVRWVLTFLQWFVFRFFGPPPRGLKPGEFVCLGFGLGLLWTREVWKRFSRSNFVCQSFTGLDGEETEERRNEVDDTVKLFLRTSYRL